jgi:hypothetical protein
MGKQVIYTELGEKIFRQEIVLEDNIKMDLIGIGYGYIVTWCD